MSKTVVALFESMDKAKQVKQTLISEGISESEISVMANDGDSSDALNATANEDGYTDIGSGGGTGIGEKISHFFRSLSGGDDETHDHYAKGVNDGGALVAVSTKGDNPDQIATMLMQHGAKAIEGNGDKGLKDTSKTYDDTRTEVPQNKNTSAGESFIPVVAEELVVGKREVDRGGVRVYSRIVETPVSTDVKLHDEKITVERHKVDRPATAADFGSGKDAVIEMSARGEEAVVGKTSRVVEEVLVGKQGSDRTEQIHDTVRHTEVEVERIDGDKLTKDRA